MKETTRQQLQGQDDDTNSLRQYKKSSIYVDNEIKTSKGLIVVNKGGRKNALERSFSSEDFRLYHTERTNEKHTYLTKNFKKTFVRSQRYIFHRSVKNSFGQDPVIVNPCQGTVVKIQVEDCRQIMVMEKLSPTTAITSPGAELSESKSSKLLKTGNDSTMTQINHNRVESVMLETPRSKNNPHYYGKTAVAGNCGRKSEEHDIYGGEVKNTETTKKFVWSGKSSKTSSKGLEKSKKEQSKTAPADKKLGKSKKTGCSPFKKLSRSSLTVDSDKIARNLSKYSPCASRLAASSKILSTDCNMDQDSPLHVVRSRSPSHIDVQAENNSKSSEKITMQASLSVNIQHLQKARFTPRSKSVGDSSVTWPQLKPQL